MSDKVLFDPDKISILEYKILKGQINSPENFNMEMVEGHHIENVFEMAFNLKDKLVKTDFTIDLKTKSSGKNAKEANANFHFVFIFKVENLEELAQVNEFNTVDSDPDMAISLASITYSTSRGILLTRLQGTAMQNFILPVIAPQTLLPSK